MILSNIPSVWKKRIISTKESPLFILWLVVFKMEPESGVEPLPPPPVAEWKRCLLHGGQLPHFELLSLPGAT